MRPVTAARWIDDPVGAVVIGTALPVAAVSVLVGGIFGFTLTYRPASRACWSRTS